VSLLPHRFFLLVPPWLLDPDARDFISRVEAADGNALENGVKIAYSNFIRGCKADGTWNAIKASCILAGARTLSGALIPMVGTAPTNLNFVSGDYNRKTGLVGNGSTKYLDSNRNNNVDPQNSSHNAVFVSTAGTGISSAYMGADVGTSAAGTNNMGTTLTANFARNRTGTPVSIAGTLVTGLLGTNRSSSLNYIFRISGTSNSVTSASQATFNGNVRVFATGAGGFPTNARLAFYSIGESLDLALLDARVTDLINALAGAI
jgi:hypothetical protein